MVEYKLVELRWECKLTNNGITQITSGSSGGCEKQAEWGIKEK
jgi:hypothetical protein